ncbi:hypothetical protein [Sphingomonas phyllosphaerae]|uniref:hypothetical protein n=1 Tax=Sphingomonas phyllosphaerae TaxID=257003 RepID=UPI0012DCCAE5|nr:hypothetical protein [Sphingomonas phyllosphaerae]
MRHTFIQLAREFWIPAVIAGSWTAWNVYSSQAMGASQIVAGFSGSFFLSSWATGQFLRVKKQAKAESSFALIEQRTSLLLDRLDTSTDRLEGVTTGGDAFCYFSPSFAQGNVQVNPFLVHSGEYPVYDVRVWMISPEEFHLAGAGINLGLGYLTPGTGRTIYQIAPFIEDLDFQFTAKNGLWTQLIRVRGGLIAYAVLRGRTHPADLLIHQYPDGFPLIGEDLFDVRLRESALTSD